MTLERSRVKRDEEKALAEFDAFFADDRRRYTLSLQAESDWFRTVARWLRTQHLWPVHVAVLTIIAQLAAGEGFGMNRVEGRRDDATLVVDDVKYGILGVPAHGLENWQQLLEWLERQQFLVIERGRGPTWRIRLGPKTLKALRTDSPRKRFRERVAAKGATGASAEVAK